MRTTCSLHFGAARRSTSSKCLKSWYQTSRRTEGTSTTLGSYRTNVISTITFGSTRTIPTSTCASWAQVTFIRKYARDIARALESRWKPATRLFLVYTYIFLQSFLLACAKSYRLYAVITFAFQGTTPLGFRTGWQRRTDRLLCTASGKSRANWLRVRLSFSAKVRHATPWSCSATPRHIRWRFTSSWCFVQCYVWWFSFFFGSFAEMDAAICASFPHYSLPLYDICT